MFKLTKPVGSIRLLPLSAAFDRVGASHSEGYRQIELATLPRPIKRGRSSFLAEHEIDAIVAARTQGLPDSEVKELVAALHAARTNALLELGISRESQAA